MTGPRRAAATALGALALTLPLLCAVTVSVNSHGETTPSAPPSARPSPNPCPEPIMSPMIRFAHLGPARDQTRRCITEKYV